MTAPGTTRVATRALLVTTAIAAATWLWIVIGHAGDRFKLNHTSGVHMALADAFHAGTLYPPLHEDGYFAGTRYMPIGTVAHGELAWLTDDLIVAGKVLSAAAVIGLVALVIIAARRLECTGPVALALGALLLTAGPVYEGSMNMRDDALAAALQIGAILLVWPLVDRRRARRAGVVVALALFTKLTAVWAAVALALWLWRHHREHLRTLVGWATGTALVLAAATFAASRGRVVPNVLGLGASDTTIEGTWARLVNTFDAGGKPALVLAIGGAVALAVGLRRALPRNPFIAAFVVSAAITVVTFTSDGAYNNHLIEPLALATLLVAWMVGPISRAVRWQPALAGVAAVALLAAGIDSYWEDAKRVPDRGFRQRPALAFNILEGRVAPGERVLSEDPSFTLALGQRNLVLDPYLFITLARRHPEWEDELIARVERHEFDVIVLTTTLDPLWYEKAFGERFRDAVEEHYERAGRIGGIRLWRPRP